MHYHAILRVGGRVLGLALGLATFSAHADYRSTILNDQPVVYLRLGESSGPTAVSETNSAYNGTYTSAGNVTFGIAGALSNVVNTAVRLNIDSYISVPGTAAFVQNTDPFTVEAWVRPRSSGMVNILSYRDPSTTRDYQFYLNNGNSMSIWAGSASQNIVNNGVTYSTDGSAWYHVVWTRSGDTFRTYLNGSQVGSDVVWASANMESPGNTYRLGTAGAYGFETQFLNGDVDEVAYYDHALNSTQVSAHYSAAMVPEPSAWVLMVAGLGGLGLLARHRHTRA